MAPDWQTEPDLKKGSFRVRGYSDTDRSPSETSHPGGRVVPDVRVHQGTAPARDRDTGRQQSAQKISRKIFLGRCGSAGNILENFSVFF